MGLIMVEADLISLSYKIHKNVENELKLQSAECNLRRNELEILLCIDRLDSFTTPSVIAVITQIKLPLVSRILDSLVKRSILKRTQDNIDRRQNFLHILPAGEALIKASKDILLKFPGSLIATLTNKEKMILSILLEPSSRLE